MCVRKESWGRRIGGEGVGNHDNVAYIPFRAQFVSDGSPRAGGNIGHVGQIVKGAVRVDVNVSVVAHCALRRGDGFGPIVVEDLEKVKVLQDLRIVVAVDIKDRVDVVIGDDVRLAREGGRATVGLLRGSSSMARGAKEDSENSDEKRDDNHEKGFALRVLFFFRDGRVSSVMVYSTTATLLFLNLFFIF